MFKKFTLNMLFKYFKLFHRKNDFVPVAKFLLLDIPSNFKRVLGLTLTSWELPRRKNRNVSALRLGAWCKNELMWRTPDHSADYNTPHTPASSTAQCTLTTC